MITEQNILLHELVGLDAEVIKSTNKDVIGIQGTIIDETKSMLILDTKKGTKKIQKDHNEWKFSSNFNEIIVQGNKITKRSNDRLGIKIWVKI